MWSLDAIADAAADTLRRRDAALREEQAVYGLDAQPELSFHPLLAAGFADAGFGVLREQPFPHEWLRKLRASARAATLNLPLPRDRQRCDIVLTPEPNQPLDDSLLTEKQRRAEEAELQGTLFESFTTSHLAPGALPTSAPKTGAVSEQRQDGAPLLCPPHTPIPPESAFWLELKVCGQHTNTSGLPGPNRTYTSDLTRAPLADLKKLANDHRIHHAGVLLIVFTADDHTAAHDISILALRTLDRGWPIAAPVLRTIPIPDRIGNTLCTACLLAMRKSSPP